MENDSRTELWHAPICFPRSHGTRSSASPLWRTLFWLIELLREMVSAEFPPNPPLPAMNHANKNSQTCQTSLMHHLLYIFILGSGAFSRFRTRIHWMHLIARRMQLKSTRISRFSSPHSQLTKPPQTVPCWIASLDPSWTWYRVIAVKANITDQDLAF